MLTGESVPVNKELGNHIVSGSINIGGVIHARATKVRGDTTLAQIIHLVENALSSRSALERTVDRASRVFVPSVIAIAILTFLVCWLGSFATTGDSLMRAITVLVIACPCALGMATPLAITAAIGAASQKGILVSEGRVLETIREVDAVILDKTGTITEGKFSLCDFEALSAPASLPVEPANTSLRTFPTAVAANTDSTTSESFFKADCLPLIAALERYSEHPLGRAVVACAEKEGVHPSAADEVQIHKGQGITGTVGGHKIFIGNRSLVEARAARMDPHFEIRAWQWEEDCPACPSSETRCV